MVFVFFSHVILISLSLLFNFGILGNPNYDTKLFLKDNDVSSIVKYNTIYLFGVDSKIQTLLSYYLPSSRVIDDVTEISKYKYVITSEINFLDNLNANQAFEPIKKFNIHKKRP